jgi:pimeloyl-ACP methyl ester carboxylesterase
MSTNPLLAHTIVQAPQQEPKLWLLVLHGIYGSGRNWGSLARRLVEQRPEWGVMLVDLRLHGASLDFAGPHTLAAAAADVDRLVDETKFQAAAVLGHSFGGKVALTYALHHAEGLRQVWVADSTLAVREPEGSAWRIIEIVRSLPDQFESREQLADALVEHGYARAVGMWLAMNLERRDGALRWRVDWQGIEELLRDYFRADLWSVIERPPHGVEVHVIRATESNSIGEEEVRRIEAAERETGRVCLHPIEGGHWMNTENPDAVLRLLASRLP